MTYQMTSSEKRLITLFKQSKLSRFFALSAMFLMEEKEEKQKKVIQILERIVKNPPKTEEEENKVMEEIAEIVDGE